MNEVFQKYADYYDFIYAEKEYQREVAFIMDLIRRYSPHARSLLDLGCGTGRHAAEFIKEGLSVWGIDASEGMVRQAKERLPEIKDHLIQSSIQEVNLNRKFDVVTSLFHVLSYQTTDQKVLEFFKTVAAHLNQDGIAIIDYWYGPAVIAQGTEPREKNIIMTGLKMHRKASATIDTEKHLAQVKVQIVIEDTNRATKQEVEELHAMRFFFLPELASFLEKAGLKAILHAEWLRLEEPSDKSWSAYMVFKKIRNGINDRSK